MLTASGIGSSIYTAVSDSLSAYFGQSVVPVEGVQITVGDISPYIGVKVPLPTPTKQLWLEVFGDAACTQPVVAGQSSVYVRLNANFGFNNTMAWEGTQAENALVSTPESEFPEDPYSVGLWLDWVSTDYTVPFEVGQVVQVVPGEGIEVQSGYNQRFYSDGTSDTPVV